MHNFVIYAYIALMAKIKQGEEGREVMECEPRELLGRLCSKIMYYLSNFWCAQLVTVATM